MMDEWITRLRESRFFVPFMILVASGVISVALFLSAPEPETREVVAPVILVDAFRVSKSSVTMTVETQGEVLARTRTTLVSEVSGVITDLADSFVAGGYFSKGDLLIKIDGRNYTSEVARARANISSGKRKLAEEEGMARYAIHDWENSEVTTEPSELARRQPQIEEAETRLQFLHAELRRTEGDLERTRVVAVYDGLVEKKEVDVGQYVSPGTKLGVVFASDVVEVRLPIPLHEVEYLNLPNSFDSEHDFLNVTLRTISQNKEVTWPGRVVRTEAVMDRKNRVLYAIAEVEDPYRGHKFPLRVGGYVSASISGRELHDIARIPRTAVRPGNKVWTISRDSQLELKVVVPIRADEHYLYVTDGIEDGDIVSITPLENPLPGMQVKFILKSDAAVVNSDD